MKVGEKITQQELKNQGWEQVDVYGDCEIWTKGIERVLWDPRTHLIVIAY